MRRACETDTDAGAGVLVLRDPSAYV